MRYVHLYAIQIELPADPDYPERDNRIERKEQLRREAEKHWPGARVLYIQTVQRKD